jgi:hypothetical protein
VRYRHPKVFWRWLLFTGRLSFPHYLGPLSARDRDLVAARCFDDCPRELANELQRLRGDEKRTYPAVRVFIVFERSSFGVHVRNRSPPCATTEPFTTHSKPYRHQMRRPWAVCLPH